MGVRFGVSCRSVSQPSPAQGPSDLTAQLLLDTLAMKVRHVLCRGSCRGRSAEEYSRTTHLVFPCRGTYVHHVGPVEAVADSNRVLFFNAGETYQVSHPVEGGDACLSISVAEELLRELVPRDQARPEGTIRFRASHRQIDSRAQAQVALLRHGLTQGAADPLEAESLTVTLIRRALGERTSHSPGGSPGARKLVDRAKLILAAAVTRRWSLSEIAKEVGVSPVYLTQVFTRVEGVPLYRYHLRLRLARALDLIDQYDNLTALSLELGFSSHSHFTAAFRHAYGRTPADFQRSARLR